MDESQRRVDSAVRRTTSRSSEPPQGSYADISGEWPGNNIFYNCCGRTAIAGPDNAAPKFTTAIIVVPVLLAILSTHKYFQELSGTPLISIGTFLLFVLSVGELWAAYFTEPGIVQRIPKSLAFRNLRQRPPATQHIPGTRFRRPIRHCQICEIYTPPRTIHCYTCGNCVAKYDHHCPWLGTCVGLRNYGHFFRFLTFALVLNMWVLAIGTVQVVDVMRTSEDLTDALGKCGATIIALIYGVVCAFFTWGMFGFHLYLILVNETTYENIGGRFHMEGNPYGSRTINCFRFVCTGSTRTFVRAQRPLAQQAAHLAETTAPTPVGTPSSTVAAGVLRRESTGMMASFGADESITDSSSDSGDSSSDGEHSGPPDPRKSGLPTPADQIAHRG